MEPRPVCISAVLTILPGTSVMRQDGLTSLTESFAAEIRKRFFSEIDALRNRLEAHDNGK